MFGPWVETWEWLKSRRPRFFSQRTHLNFITIHYLYILACTLIGSILLFPAGGMHYIDSLFFASGAATQSGLNTLDVNNIRTYQQIIIHIIPGIANPIFINTFVVFIRLYWFEKRFRHIVREASSNRRTRSRSKTETKDDRKLDQMEKGVNGRNIVVLHRGQDEPPTDPNPSQANREQLQSNLDDKETSLDQSASSGSFVGHAPADQDHDSHVAGPELINPPLHRDITFADGWLPKETPAPTDPLPVMRPAEDHVTFLENQRNPKDKGTLRIPGPRDFDRGVVPETLAEDKPGAELTKQTTSPSEASPQISGGQGWAFARPSELNADDHIARSAIAIDEPTSPRANTEPRSFSNLKLRRPGPLNAPSFSKTISAARSRTGTWSSLKNSPSKNPMPYLSWTPTMGRNSAFFDLTQKQREELGGIEYRALKTLAIILVAYYLFFHIFGVVCLLPWIIRSGTYGPVVDSNGQSRAWWGIFTPASMFNDVGFTLTADSMISFQKAVFPLLLGSFLIIIGNTGFPCMLRFIIWVCSHLVPRDSGIWEELKFLLDHPRRCFTLLFPSKATWWLFWILVILNGLDLVFFIVLDLKDPTVTSLPPGNRVVDGLFQATSTRTAGLACVNLAALHPAIQVSYLIMMYISVFPIAISVRNTNVYEEKSLGIYGSMDEQAENGKDPSYIGAHLRKQLSFDLWYVFLGLFIVAIAEGPRIEDTNDNAFTMFSILFEIVSAYGNVGMSLGYPNVNASFSSQFNTVSKLVVIAMQIRGRHRGLPYELDRAVLLPNESLTHKEERNADNRMLRRNSNLSTMEPARQGLLPRPPSETGQVNGSAGRRPSSMKSETEGHRD